MIKIRRALLVSFSVFTTLGLLACDSGGGGGSGSGFGGAADIDISADPQTIDTGDRTTVEINISNVTDEGIQLKVRFPDNLQYVDGSAELEVDEDSKDLTPGTLVQVEDDFYLVFYLTQKMFGDSEEGEVTFQLEGADSSDQSTIAVDPDSDSTQTFDPATPEFASEGEVDVEVVK